VLVLTSLGCVKPAVHQTFLDLERHFGDYRLRTSPVMGESPEGVTLTTKLGDKIADELAAGEEATR
jgi:hypothetical protein